MKATNKPEMKPEVRVLKTATCPSLSGKSKLTYQIGAQENDQGVCTPKSEVQFRIHANSGKGFFSDNWVPVTALMQLLDKTKQITSFSIFPLIRGKSVNTAGFILAAARQEGLVRPGSFWLHSRMKAWCATQRKTGGATSVEIPRHSLPGSRRCWTRRRLPRYVPRRPRRPRASQ